MRQQRNLFQTKEQDKNPEVELSAVEIKKSNQSRVQSNDDEVAEHSWEKINTVRSLTKSWKI